MLYFYFKVQLFSYTFTKSFAIVGNLGLRSSTSHYLHSGLADIFLMRSVTKWRNTKNWCDKNETQWLKMFLVLTETIFQPLRDSVSWHFQTPRSLSKNTLMQVVFSTLLSVFGNDVNTVSRVWYITYKESSQRALFRVVSKELAYSNGSVRGLLVRREYSIEV